MGTVGECAVDRILGIRSDKTRLTLRSCKCAKHKITLVGIHARLIAVDIPNKHAGGIHPAKCTIGLIGAVGYRAIHDPRTVTCFKNRTGRGIPSDHPSYFPRIVGKAVSESEAFDLHGIVSACGNRTCNANA